MEYKISQPAGWDKAPDEISCTMRAHHNGKPGTLPGAKHYTYCELFPLAHCPILLSTLKGHVLGSAKTCDIPAKEGSASPRGGYTVVCTALRALVMEKKKKKSKVSALLKNFLVSCHFRSS